MQFHSLDDARRYLEQSIVNVPIEENGPPRYLFAQHVEVSRGVNRLTGRSLGPNPSNVSINLDETTVPSQPVRIGNMVYNDRVVYTMRMPARRTQMGLTGASLRFTEITQDRAHRNIDFYDAIEQQGFVDMLTNNYGSVRDAVTARTPRPFSRDFAVNPIMLTGRHLHYKGEIVGEFSGTTFTIYEPVAYVADVLRRCLQQKGEPYEISVAS